MNFNQLLKQELEVQRKFKAKKLAHLVDKRQRFSKPEANEEPWAMAEEITRYYEQKIQEFWINCYQTEKLITKLDQFETKCSKSE